MWQYSGVLSISKGNLYNDLGSHVCKNHTSFKLQALRHYSEVLSISERNFHSAQIRICANDSNLVYKLCILLKCISLFFSLFYIDIMTKCWNTCFPWSVFSRISTESYPYFPVFRQILWFCPNTEKYEYDTVHIPENTAQKKPIFWHTLRTTFLCRNFNNRLTWKHNPFRDIEKFHQPSTITPLQLGIIIESFRR